MTKNNNVETKTNGNNSIETNKPANGGAAANSKVAEMTPEAVPETKPAKITDAAEKNRMIEMILKVGEEKQEAAKKRQQFLNTKTALKDLKERLRKSKDFEVDFCKLSIKQLASVGYNAEFKDMFNISNRELLLEFCEWLEEHIDAKLESLEEELLK